MLSEIPHLHAAHWKISSVVPVKLPVIRGLYVCWNVASYAGSLASVTGCFGFVLFACVLSERGSHGERCTRAAHVASDGSAAPGGRVWK